MKFIPEQPRISGIFPVGVNGSFVYLTENANFTDSVDLLAALDGAGIIYSDPSASSGTLTGRIRILATGTGYSVGVNGDLLYIPANQWFTPTNSQLQVIQAASGLVIEVEYQTSSPNPNLLTNGSFDSGGTGWNTPGVDYVNFAGGQALIDDQFGDLGNNSTGLLQTGVVISNVHYDVSVTIASRVRGSFSVGLGSSTNVVGGPISATGTTTFSNVVAGSGGNFNIGFSANAKMVVDEVILTAH